MSERIIALARLAAAQATGDQTGVANALRAARDADYSWEQCYEALLQLVAYTGYPRTLNALATYRAVSGVPTPEQPTEPWSKYAVKVWPERGASVFRQLWLGHELADNLRPVSPELAEWVINDDFGRIFGRPGFTLLEREALVLGSIVAQRATPQLRSHRLAFLAVGGSDAQIDEITSALTDMLPSNALADARTALKKYRAQ